MYIAPKKRLGAQTGLFLGILALMVLAPSARADLIYTLTQDCLPGNCGTNPFGQVDLLALSATTVQVTVTLFNSDKFMNTDAHHEAFAFSIGGAAVTIGALPAGFAMGAANNTDAGFGIFGYSINCPGCGTGGMSGPLTFDVSRASGLSESSFIKDPRGFMFAADIIGNNGQKGNVAALATVPEFHFYGLLLVALLGGIAVARKYCFA